MAQQFKDFLSYQQTYQEQVPEAPKKKHVLRWVLIIVGVLFVLGIVAGALNNASNNGTNMNTSVATQDTTSSNDNPISVLAQPTPTEKPKQWATTQNFIGSGSKATQVFTIGDQVKLSWKGDTSSFYGGEYNLIIELRSGQAGSVGNYINTPINMIVKSGNTLGSTILLGEEGSTANVYLDIVSEGSYTITLQELQ